MGHNLVECKSVYYCYDKPIPEYEHTQESFLMCMPEEEPDTVPNQSIDVFEGAFSSALCAVGVLIKKPTLCIPFAKWFSENIWDAVNK